MKPRNNNTRGSNHSTSPSLPSKLSRIGLTLTLVALFLCSLTVSAATCKLVSGPILTEIAVGSSQTWGLDGSGNAYQYDKSTKAFNKIADLPAPLTKITVGEGKSVWALDKDGNVYQYIFPSGPFVQEDAPLQLSQISAGAATSAGSKGVWGVGLTGGVHYWNGTKFVTYSQSGFPPSGATVKFISVGQAQPFALDSNGHAYLYNNDTGFFDGPLGASGGGQQVLSQISVGSELNAWGINSSDDIYVYNDITEVFDQVSPPQHLSSISVLNSDVPWGLGETSQHIYKYVSGTFDDACPAVSTFKQVAAGATAATTWAITTGGAIYNF
jgi:virginiamycin B lyase